MWNRAPRWVRWTIGLFSGLFATAFGLTVVALLLLVSGLQGCELEFALNQPDPNPALTAAIDRCDEAAVEAEIDKGGRPFIDGRFTNYEDGPDLSEALACGPEMADLLLAYAVSNGGGDSILHAAVALDDADLVARALDAGVDVDALDDAGDTALLDAATEGDLAMVGLLLDRGADPNLGNESGHTPLFRAVGLDHPEVAGRLLAAGADPNRTAGVTSLELVAAESLRVERGAKPGVSSYQGAIDALGPALGLPLSASTERIEPLTPLYLAVAVGSDEMVVALLAAGADPAVGSGPAGHLPADAADLLGRADLAARIRSAAG